MDIKGATVALKILYNATFADIRKHHGWGQMIKTAEVLIYLQQNSNSVIPGPMGITANRVILKKEMVMEIIIVVNQQKHQLKQQE